MLRKIFSTYFVATWLAVTFAAGLVWLDQYRGYVAETEILIVERSGVTHAGESLTELVSTLSFYNAVLARNDALSDPFSDEALDVRKAHWQRVVSVEHKDGSGVYILRTFSKESSQALLLARETVGALFDAAGRYYNLKSDIDVRIVDGPMVQAEIRPLPQFIAVTLLTGFVVTFVFFFLLYSLENVGQNGIRKAEKKLEHDSESDMHITPDTFRPAKPAHWTVSSSPLLPEAVIQEPIEKNEKKETESAPSPLRAGHQAQAPANLPILEDSALYPLQGAMARLVKEDVDATARERAAQIQDETSAPVSEPRVEEPTEEEYKRRLNELLSGKM